MSFSQPRNLPAGRRVKSFHMSEGAGSLGVSRDEVISRVEASKVQTCGGGHAAFQVRHGTEMKPSPEDRSFAVDLCGEWD